MTVAYDEATHLAEIAELRAEGYDNCPRCELMKRDRAFCEPCERELLGFSLHAPVSTVRDPDPWVELVPWLHPNPRSHGHNGRGHRRNWVWLRPWELRLI